MIGLLLRTAIYGALLYIGLLLALMVPSIQRHVLFLHKINYPWPARYDEPERYGFMPNSWRSFHITTSDGVQIGATHILPTSTHSQLAHDANSQSDRPEIVFDSALKERPTVLYFHGNAGNRLAPFRLQTARAFTHEVKFNFLAIDYRGFGDSDMVHPSEEGLAKDALAAFEWLEAKGIEANQVFIMGQSLGTGVAIKLAATLSDNGTPPVACVAVAPYTSIPALLSTYKLMLVIPILSPLRAVPPLHNFFLRFLNARFDSLALIDQVKSPILLVHAKNDLDIPSSHSQILFDRVAQPESVQVLTQSRHSTLHSGETTYNQKILFLESDFGGHNVIQYSAQTIHIIKSLLQ